MPLYSDLNTYEPTEEPLLEDVESIYQSIDSIINSQMYEILFDPEYPGESLDDSLFDLIDDISSVEVFRVVTSLIERNEPRVTIDDARTSVTPDPDNHQYQLRMVFQIKGFGSQKYEMNGNITRPRRS